MRGPASSSAWPDRLSALGSAETASLNAKLFADSNLVMPDLHEQPELLDEASPKLFGVCTQHLATSPGVSQKAVCSVWLSGLAAVRRDTF